MDKHTPGSWKADGSQVYVPVKRSDCSAGKWHYAPSIGGPSWSEEGAQEEFEANARLIATAPELKLACEGALVALRLGEYVDKNQAIAYLEEVLAKL